MIRLFTVLLIISVCFGCSWSRQKFNVEDFHKKAAAIKIGETKAADLESIFGSPPNAIIPFKESSIHLYNFGDTKTESFNLLIVNFQKSNVGLDSAMFFVDESGIVKDAVISNNSQNLNWEYWPFGGN
jgi:hypothetical protein